jgi:hypothetical protein
VQMMTTLAIVPAPAMGSTTYKSSDGFFEINRFKYCAFFCSAHAMKEL